jgi:hypothetical protein
VSVHIDKGFFELSLDCFYDFLETLEVSLIYIYLSNILFKLSNPYILFQILSAQILNVVLCGIPKNGPI